MIREDVASERDRFIDFLRVLGVAIVVLGHWAVFVVFWEGDTVIGINALSEIPSIRPVTWIVQVMPLMFFIGGFSNSRSFDRHEGSTGAFLSNRLIRLLWPTTVFVAIWLVLGTIQAAANLAPPDLLRRAADVAALPFWFIGIYLIAVGLVPLSRLLHERYRWWVPAVLAGGAVTVDIVSRGLGIGDVGAINYLFVWLLAHQLGYFYADGTLQAMGRGGAAAIAGSGFAGMLGLITWFRYPVSMVEVPGQATSNTAPPSIGLVFLALWLIGLAMAVRQPLTRWLRRERPWRIVTRFNGVVLTAYLWHVTAITASVAILYPLGFPQPDIGTGQWWLLRPVFVASMVPLLAVLLALFGRFEVHPRIPMAPGSFGGRRVAAMAFGVFSAAVCLLGFGISGFIELADADGASLLVFQFNPLQNVLHGLIGAAAIGVALRKPEWAMAATLVGGGLFLVGGWLELGEARTVLGMNDVTAVAHLIAGGMAVTGGLASLLGSEDPKDGTAAPQLNRDNGA